MDLKSIIRRIWTKRVDVKAKCHLKWINSWNRDPFKQITRRIGKNRKHKTKVVISAINKLCFSNVSPSRLSLLSHCWVSRVSVLLKAPTSNSSAKAKNRKLREKSVLQIIFGPRWESHFSPAWNTTSNFITNGLLI